MRGRSFQISLVVFTTLVVAGLITAVFWHERYKKENVQISCVNNPIIGDPSAKVRMVLFEDVRCYNCQIFIKAILPTIKEKYIDTKKANITFVPLAFLKGSNIPSNAELCVYRVNPQQFYPFVEKMHSADSGEITSTAALLQNASEVGEIDVLQLRQCMRQNFFYNHLSRNLECGKEVMGKRFGTPTLYVNGVKVKYLTIENISQEIERNL